PGKFLLTLAIDPEETSGSQARPRTRPFFGIAIAGTNAPERELTRRCGAAKPGSSVDKQVARNAPAVVFIGLAKVLEEVPFLRPDDRQVQQDPGRHEQDQQPIQHQHQCDTEQRNQPAEIAGIPGPGEDAVGHQDSRRLRWFSLRAVSLQGPASGNADRNAGRRNHGTQGEQRYDADVPQRRNVGKQAERQRQYPLQQAREEHDEDRRRNQPWKHHAMLVFNNIHANRLLSFAHSQAPSCLQWRLILEPRAFWGPESRAIMDGSAVRFWSTKGRGLDRWLS